MSVTYDQAKDDMNALVKTALRGDGAAIIGYQPDIRWPGLEPAAAPDNAKFFFRVSYKMVVEDTQMGSPGGGGTKTYESNGLVFVQCFGPMTGDAQVWAKLNACADLVKFAFGGTRTVNGVVLRNSTRKELTPDNKFQRINVTAEFVFNEVR